jgi:hypothetical protein|tara:strand:- start:3303 stop:3563 length:261 start_codon:yes stop_codon:yes gene_type:complete
MIIEIVLGLLVVIEGYVIWNLFRKTEFLETWVEDFTQVIQQVDTDLKEIDSTGHFESDDEIGSIFEAIKGTVKQLETFKGEDVNAS